MSFIQKYAYYAASGITLLRDVRPLGQLLALFLGTRPPQPVRVTLAPLGLSFKVRSAMDVWALKETLLDHFYERTGFALQDGWTVVDIGGGVGDFTICAAHGFPNSRVIAFEPTPSSFALLQENLSANHITNAVASQVAVWSSDGEVEIDTGQGEEVQFTSSARVMINATPGKVVVAGYSLASALEHVGVDHVDLIKLDCEGAEYEILMQAAPDTLARIDRIVMEYHDLPDGRNHTQLAQFLSERGWQVRVTPNAVHDNIGYLSAKH